jgi:hypothetical protein
MFVLVCLSHFLSVVKKSVSVHIRRPWVDYLLAGQKLSPWDSLGVSRYIFPFLDLLVYYLSECRVLGPEVNLPACRSRSMSVTFLWALISLF